MQQHLVWKGKVYHTEPVENNEKMERKMFGIKIYQIGGSYIYRLPGFDIPDDMDKKKGKKNKKNKNSMEMTGRIEHCELEKYLLKSKENDNKKLVCCKISVTKEFQEAQKLIKHLKNKDRCARFRVGDKSRCNYFDFYIIPPTKANIYLNYKFVANHFNATISNKKMWGVILMPIHSLLKVNNDKSNKSGDIQRIDDHRSHSKKKHHHHRHHKSNKRDNNYSPEIEDDDDADNHVDDDDYQLQTTTTKSVLDDSTFFTNLDSLASLLDVDNNINQNENTTTIIADNIPVDPRKRR